MPAAEPSAVITQRGAARLEAGHPWIYKSDVRSVNAQGGDVVRLTDERGRFRGRAFYSDSSQIALRLLTAEDVPVNREFFAARLRAAAAHRLQVVSDTQAFRMVYGEGDRLPSIVVDRYGAYLVVQTLSQGSERIKDDLVSLLVDQFAPRGILERNDPRVRLREGLPQRVTVLHGDVPAVVTAEMNGLRFQFDLFKGQKTGGFLDQRENYRAAAQYARGDALDCFAYTGGFGLTLAAKCRSVECLDQSAEAVAAAQQNAALNGLANLTFRAANVFDVLKEYDEAGRRFDTIVLDPPAFAKDRASVPAALRGYKEINLRSMRLLRPGGYLITCSCSHHIAEPVFLQMLAEAGQDTGRELRVVERRTQGRDHPIMLTAPETVYIKCFILNCL
jgi:23S rRNA (cytosine1962-C5)-methyltransferase